MTIALNRGFVCFSSVGSIEVLHGFEYTRGLYSYSITIFKYHSLPLFRYKNCYHSALCISSSLFTQAWNEAGLRYPRAREPCENGYYFFMVRFLALSRLVQENGDKRNWNRCGDNHDNRRHVYRWGSKLGTAGDPIFLVMLT